MNVPGARYTYSKLILAHELDIHVVQGSTCNTCIHSYRFWLYYKYIDEYNFHYLRAILVDTYYTDKFSDELIPVTLPRFFINPLLLEIVSGQ